MQSPAVGPNRQFGHLVSVVAAPCVQRLFRGGGRGRGLPRVGLARLERGGRRGHLGFGGFHRALHLGQPRLGGVDGQPRLALGVAGGGGRVLRARGGGLRRVQRRACLGGGLSRVVVEAHRPPHDQTRRLGRRASPVRAFRPAPGTGLPRLASAANAAKPGGSRSSCSRPRACRASPLPNAPMASSVVFSRSLNAGLSGVPSSAARADGPRHQLLERGGPRGHQVGVAGGLSSFEQRLLGGAHAVRRLQKRVEDVARVPIQLVHQPGRVARLGQAADPWRTRRPAPPSSASPPRRCGRRRTRQTAPGTGGPVRDRG